MDVRALAYVGMPRVGAVSRKVLQDVTGPDFQKLAEELAAHILADPESAAWSAQVTRDELARALRELSSRGALAHAAGKGEDAELITTDALMVLYEEVYNAPYPREELIVEVVMMHVIKAVREGLPAFPTGKETGARKFWERYPWPGARGAKQIEMRAFRVDVDTSAMYAGQAEVCDITEIGKMETVPGLWFRLLHVVMLAGMGLGVPEGFSHKGRGKLGDQMVWCHLRDVLALCNSYKKLAHFEPDPRAMIVHIDECIDLLWRYTTEDKMTAGAAYYTV